MKLASTILLALPLALLFTSACSGRSEVSSSTTQHLDLSGGGSQPTPHRPFLHRIPRAPESTAFEGVRRVKFRFDLFGQTHDFECLERVQSDGQGQFAIDPLEVVEPELPEGEVEVFEMVQKGREAFFFRYRDFRVSELALFLTNYEVIELGGAHQVAGRDVVRLEVRRIEDPDRFYVVSVDPSNGLVLAYEERDLEERLIAEMTFESLTLAPDLEGAVLGSDTFPSSPIDLQANAEQVLGFKPLKPTWTPPGYQLRETRRQVVEGEYWARFLYGDGLEKLFFLHFREPDTLTQGHPRVQSAGTSDRPAGPADRVRSFGFGPWTVIEGQVGQYRVILCGKVPQEDLLLMLQSALD